jgi:hypothetical protein
MLQPVGAVSVQFCDTYCPAGHERLHVCQSWSVVVFPVHGLSVKTAAEEFAGLGLHLMQAVVSWAASPVHLGPARYSPVVHDALHVWHFLSVRVRPVQNPLMYCLGGLAVKDRHRPLHCTHVLDARPDVVHRLEMYWPFSLVE